MIKIVFSGQRLAKPRYTVNCNGNRTLSIVIRLDNCYCFQDHLSANLNQHLSSVITKHIHSTEANHHLLHNVEMSVKLYPIKLVNLLYVKQLLKPFNPYPYKLHQVIQAYRNLVNERFLSGFRVFNFSTLIQKWCFAVKWIWSWTCTFSSSCYLK